MTPTFDPNSTLARCLVDEWERGGLTQAVVCPGSRSTPLALALAENAGFNVHVRLDERSAAFFGLGLAKANGRPTVLVCTSGTAAANFHPAVLEAFHSCTPLIVASADRPRELHDVGAGQTVEQRHLYGEAVRWFFEPEAPSWSRGIADALAHYRALGARALCESVGPPSGPVHLNLPFREPLVAPRDQVPPFDFGGRPDHRPWTSCVPVMRIADDAALDELAERIASTPRGLVVVGWGAGQASDGRAPSSVVDARDLERFSRAAGWPVLADAVSGLRSGPCVISAYDALSRVERLKKELAPELVLRLGAPLTSKFASGWLSAAPAISIDPDRSWSDPERACDLRLETDPKQTLDALSGRLEAAGAAAGEWAGAWFAAERKARQTMDTLLDSWSKPFEGRVARDLFDSLPAGTSFVVASSMPVRDVEAFCRPRPGINVVSNRGCNGIDGFVSTVLGIASARRGDPTVALVGDLCFLHDSSALAGARGAQIDALFVVIDNSGGGIFSFLPQASLDDHFEELFLTPQDVEVRAVAELYEIPLLEVQRADDLATAVLAALSTRGIRMIRVRTRAAENVALHRVVSDAVERSFDIPE